MFVNLLADESFDLDVNVEEIDDEEYNAENEHAYAQPYIKQFPEYVFDNSKEGSSEGGNSRLARFAQLNLDSTTSAANSEKKRNSNGKPGFDPRGYLVTPNEKLPLRQGYREVLTNTESQRERTFDPNDRERRYSHAPGSSLGDHKRKYATMTKKKRHPDGRPDSSSSSFGTLMQNQLDKKKALTSGIGFIKPYKRKQMNRTSSNMSNDKLLSIKQIYIDNIEKEKSKNPYSRTQSRSNLDDF